VFPPPQPSGEEIGVGVTVEFGFAVGSTVGMSQEMMVPVSPPDCGNTRLRTVSRAMATTMNRTIRHPFENFTFLPPFANILPQPSLVKIERTW